MKDQKPAVLKGAWKYLCWFIFLGRGWENDRGTVISWLLFPDKLLTSQKSTQMLALWCKFYSKWKTEAGSKQRPQTWEYTVDQNWTHCYLVQACSEIQKDGLSVFQALLWMEMYWYSRTEDLTICASNLCSQNSFFKVDLDQLQMGQSGFSWKPKSPGTGLDFSPNTIHKYSWSW